MILASHNSWSFAAPSKFWMKCINFTSKCQNKDIIAQYLAGVRYFDLRLEYDDKGKSHVAHGLVHYDYTFDDVLDDLKALNKVSDTVYVRVSLDTRNLKKINNKKYTQFAIDCVYLQQRFTNIIFVGGKCIGSWDTVFRFEHDDADVTELYSSVDKRSKLIGLFPKHYAKAHNKTFKENVKGKGYLMIDFI